MQEILASLLPVALAQPLYISTNAQEEAHENLFCFGSDSFDLSLLTAPTVEEWLQVVLAGKRQQLLTQRGHNYPMQFYCWHDAQASQLRFSLVAAAVALPFGCTLRLVELSVVVQEFLAQGYLVFDNNLLAPDSATGQLSAAEEFVLPVWRTVIL